MVFLVNVRKAAGAGGVVKTSNSYVLIDRRRDYLAGTSC